MLYIANKCNSNSIRAVESYYNNIFMSTLITAFFTDNNLKRVLTYLCNSRPPDNLDPITATVIDLLTSRVQFCLGATGLIPFKGKASMVYPYHMMTAEQKQFLQECLRDKSSYSICNDSIMFHCELEKIDAVSVLEAMCSKILESGVHGEHSVRVGVCNILLQRVQSVVPITRGVQQRLNSMLFK